MSLKYGSIPVVDETLDFCDLVTQINKQCPLKKGTFTIDIPKEEIPDYIPSVSIFLYSYATIYIQGAYEGKAVLNDQNGKELLCFKIKLEF